MFSLIPKENTTVSIGSVLKWRARSHCQQSSVDTQNWRAISKQSLYTIVIVPFSFGIRENTMFSNVIDSYHLVDERCIRVPRVQVQWQDTKLHCERTVHVVG
jgi:hypothetical protein